MVSGIASPLPTRRARTAPQTIPFGPYDDFSATQAQLEAFGRLLERDKRRNLLDRFSFFSKQDSQRTVARMGFVPLVIQHGFASLSLSRSRGPSAVCSVGLYYTFGVPDVILIDNRWRVDVHLGRAIEVAGKLLRYRRDRFKGMTGERAVSKALRRALQFAGQPLQSLGRGENSDLELHPYGFGDYFYRHYMDRTEVPLLVGHTGPASLPLPTRC